MKKLFTVIIFFLGLGSACAQSHWKIKDDKKTYIIFENPSGKETIVSTRNRSIDFNLLRAHSFYTFADSIGVDILRYGLARIYRYKLATPQEIGLENFARNHHYGRWQINYLQRVNKNSVKKHHGKKKRNEVSASGDTIKVTQTDTAKKIKLDTGSKQVKVEPKKRDTTNHKATKMSDITPDDPNYIWIFGHPLRIDLANLLIAFLGVIATCLGVYIPVHFIIKASRSKRKLNIVIVGDNGVGKSSLNLILKKSNVTHQDISQIESQNGIIQESLIDRIELRNKIEFTAITTQVPFTDENFRKREILNEADIIIFVVACCSRQTRYTIERPFINSQLQELNRHLNMVSKKKSIKMIGLFINKSDIVNRQNEDLTHLFNNHITRCQNKADELGIVFKHWYRSCLVRDRNVNMFSELLDILQINRKL